MMRSTPQRQDVVSSGCGKSLCDGRPAAHACATGPGKPRGPMRVAQSACCLPAQHDCDVGRSLVTSPHGISAGSEASRFAGCESSRCAGSEPEASRCCGGSDGVEHPDVAVGARQRVLPPLPRAGHALLHPQQGARRQTQTRRTCLELWCSLERGEGNYVDGRTWPGG
eukprot:3341844-Rhodomonas_salina.1